MNLKIRSSWVRVDPKSNDKFLTREKMGRRHREESDVKMETEIKVMHLQVREHQGLLIATRKLGERHAVNSSSEPPDGTNIADALILDFRLPKL